MIVLIGFTFLVVSAVLLQHGSLRLIGETRLRGEIALPILLVLQAVARGRAAIPISIRLPWGPVFPWLAITVAMLFVLVLNWRVRGMPLAVAGTLLNLLVVAINMGMPVVVHAGPLRSDLTAASFNGFYRFGQATLPVLGDAVSAPGTGGGLLLSVGDVLLLTGVSVLILDAALRNSKAP